MSFDRDYHAATTGSQGAGLTPFPATLGTPSSPSAVTIPQELDRQYELLMSGQKLVSLLEDRLALVLRPRDNGNGASAAPAPVHVLERVSCHTQVLLELLSRVQSVCDRVAL